MIKTDKLAGLDFSKPFYPKMFIFPE